MTTPPALSLLVILPESILTLLASFIFVVEPFVPKKKKAWIGRLSVVGLLLSGLTIIPLVGRDITAFAGMITLDAYALLFKGILLLIAAAVVTLSFRYVRVEKIEIGEYYGLILFATVGAMLLAASTDLLSIYLSLELMSISFYVLAAFMRKDPKSVESGIKYFLTGVFTSGIILYGIALLYGMAGTTHLGAISAYLSSQEAISPLYVVAIILLIAGVGFKIAAVPFHMWAPDVYEGAPTPVTAFLSTGSKIAVFAAFIRILMTGLHFDPSHFGPLGDLKNWGWLLWWVAALTMTFGNIAALTQTNFKRLLAYSSIAQSGYLLIGLVAASETGRIAVLIYAIAYALMTLGAFATSILLCDKNSRGDQISDFQGVARQHPAIAAAFVIFALSLVGIPPTAGFIGKLYLFNAAIQEGFYSLAVIGILNSVVSLYYYFKIIVAMYMEEAEEERVLSVSRPELAVLAAMAIGTLLLGLYPEAMIRMVMTSVQIFS